MSSWALSKLYQKLKIVIESNSLAWHFLWTVSKWVCKLNFKWLLFVIISCTLVEYDFHSNIVMACFFMNKFANLSRYCILLVKVLSFMYTTLKHSSLMFRVRIMLDLLILTFHHVPTMGCFWESKFTSILVIILYIRQTNVIHNSDDINVEHSKFGINIVEIEELRRWPDTPIHLCLSFLV